MDALREIFTGVLDLIYPEKSLCLFCGSELHELNRFQICKHCFVLLPFTSESVCPTCGRQKETLEEKCECSEMDIQFDSASSVFQFNGIIQSALHRLKYEGEVDIAAGVGQFMAKKLREKKWHIDIILPVPLHSDRLKERGFNQSRLLSDEIGRECGIDVLDNLLIRKRHTKSQVDLSRNERIHNMKDAFEVVKGKSIQGAAILVVDDIMTTGTTLNECCRVLRQNGAAKIHCLTAANAK